MWSRLKKLSALTKMPFRRAHQSAPCVPSDVKPPDYWVKRAVENRDLVESARGLKFNEVGIQLAIKNCNK